MKARAEALQPGAQLAMVVDLAVKDDGEGAVLLKNRLLTAREVDNAQAAHCHPDVTLDKESIIVRTTVDYLSVHRGQDVALNAASVIRIQDSADSAHSASHLFRHRRTWGRDWLKFRP